MPEPQRLEDLLLPSDAPQRLEDLLAQAREREQNIQRGFTPGGLTPEEQAAGREFFTRTVPRVGLVTAGSLAAGPGIIPGAIGAAGGDILFQAGRQLAGGETMRPGESLRIGAEALGGGALMRGLVRGGAAVGGIAKEFLDYAGRSLRPFKKGEGFRLTIGRPPQEAELELGRKIQGAVEDVSSRLSEGRIAKEALIKDATVAGKRVSVQPVVDKLREFVIPDATEASAKNFNSKLTKFANELEERDISFSKAEITLKRAKETAKRVAIEAEIVGAPDAKLLRQAAETLAKKPVKGTVGLTPEEFDILMTKELSPAAFTGTGKPSLNRFSAAIRAARNTAKETLETTIPEVRAANRAAFEELTMHEQAEAVFGPSKLSLETKLRNLFKPGHVAEQQLLNRIGKEAGIPLLEEAKRLATKRAFTRDDRITAGVLNRVFLLTGTPQIARGIAKIGAPLQPFAGPAAGGLGATLEEAFVGPEEGVIRRRTP